jgi:hypothetical protein
MSPIEFEHQAGGQPPQLGVDGFIVEGLVTTVCDDGRTNISPMGPIVEDSFDRLWLRPFRTSQTYANLKRTGRGVFHITDDVELLAQAAVGQPDPLPGLAPAKGFDGMLLADACRWYAFEVESLDDAAERTSIVGRVVDRGVLREFLGFNRAKHAVLEAAIVATRISLLDPAEIAAQLGRSAVIVQKTGAAAERRAMEFLRDYIDRRLAEPAGKPLSANAAEK